MNYKTLAKIMILGAGVSATEPFSKRLFEERIAYAQPSPRQVQYAPTTNPIQPNARITTVAQSAYDEASNDQSRLEALMRRIRVGARPDGLVFADSSRPKTAIETRQGSGDCSDMANVVMAQINEMNRLGATISGGVYEVNFNGIPANQLHAIVYVEINGRRMLFDPQIGRLVENYPRPYRVVVNYPNFDSARAFYHREMGEYFAVNRDFTNAAVAYETSLQIFPNNARVTFNLGVAYAQTNRHQNALQQYETAARIDPTTYGSMLPRLRYDSYNNMAVAAFNSREWAGCIRNLEEARRILTSQNPVPSVQVPTERLAIERDLGACRANQQRTNEPRN